MRPLSNNEKQLLLVFGFLIIAYGHWWGYGEWKGWQKKIQQEEIDLTAEKTAALIWMEKKELWTKRQQFLSEKLPAAKEPDLASAELIDSIEKGAKAAQLTISDRALLPTKSLPHAFQTTATVKLTGKFENVVQWLHQLQSPQNFTVVQKTVIKSDANPPQVLGEFEISRWYQPTIKP